MKKIHKYIILGLLCLFASLEAFAQEVLISGVVKDKNDNQPLPYVYAINQGKLIHDTQFPLIQMVNLH